MGRVPYFRGDARRRPCLSNDRHQGGTPHRTALVCPGHKKRLPPVLRRHKLPTL